MVSLSRKIFGKISRKEMWKKFKENSVEEKPTKKKASSPNKPKKNAKKTSKKK